MPWLLPPSCPPVVLPRPLISNSKGAWEMHFLCIQARAEEDGERMGLRAGQANGRHGPPFCCSAPSAPSAPISRPRSRNVVLAPGGVQLPFVPRVLPSTQGRRQPLTHYVHRNSLESSIQVWTLFFLIVNLSTMNIPATKSSGNGKKKK